MQRDEDARAYFTALHALKSDDPPIRRPAISALMTLAQRAAAPIRARAAGVLVKEFGPFVVIDGLSGCTAPIAAVHECDANGCDCSACEWLWSPP